MTVMSEAEKSKPWKVKTERQVVQGGRKVEKEYM